MVKVIAVDGPSGSGKSSTSRLVGRQLGFLHVDSGALYRIITWQCLLHGVDVHNAQAVAQCAAHVPIACEAKEGELVYSVDGVVPTECLRTVEVNQAASPVATVREVRARITSLLQSFVQFGPLIVEGRDITTAVFPHTPARFYLTASADARAQRRQKEELQSGVAHQSAAEVKASLLMRDQIDSTRQYAPLRKADGVIEIDTTNLSLEQVVHTLIQALPKEWRT